MSSSRSERSRERARRRVRGGVLAEFAILGFVVWLLLAGVLELGRALTVQQILQTNARVLARELARVPLAADIGFDAAVENVLDTRFLVIDSALLDRCGRADFGEAGHDADLDALFATLPFGNRLLRPLMIADRRGDQRTGVGVVRWLGADHAHHRSRRVAEDDTADAVQAQDIDDRVGHDDVFVADVLAHRTRGQSGEHQLG